MTLLFRRFMTAMKAHPLDGTALVVSVAAFIASIGSLVISRDAQKQAALEFRQERQLVLTGEFEHPKADYGTCSSIKIKPINQDFRFQTGAAFLPTTLYKDPIPIANDGQFEQMGTVCYELQKVVKVANPFIKDNIQIGDGSIPMVIKSFYAVKGESYSDVSLYVIDTMVIVSDKEFEDPSIKFDGLTFVERLPYDQPVNLQRLDELAESPTGLNVRPKAP